MSHFTITIQKWFYLLWQFKQPINWPCNTIEKKTTNKQKKKKNRYLNLPEFQYKLLAIFSLYKIAYHLYV